MRDTGRRQEFGSSDTAFRTACGICVREVIVEFGSSDTAFLTADNKAFVLPATRPLDHVVKRLLLISMASESP